MMSENVDYLSEIEHLLKLVPVLLPYERLLPCVAKEMKMDAQWFRAMPPDRYNDADFERIEKIFEDAMKIAKKMGDDRHWIKEARQSLRECAYHLVRASFYIKAKHLDRNVSYYSVPGLWRHKVANAWSSFIWSHRF